MMLEAVLAGLPKVSLEDEDEDEDEQRNTRMKMKDGKGEGDNYDEDEDDDDDEDEDNQQNKMKMSSDKDGDWNFDTARMFCNTDSKAIQPSIFNQIREKEVKRPERVRHKLQPIQKLSKQRHLPVTSLSSLGQKKVCPITNLFLLSYERKEGTDMDIFWCIVDALAQECNHGKFSDVRRRHEDQFFALIGDTCFSSPLWLLDSGASVCSTGDCNLLLGLHCVDPVSAANGQSISYNSGSMYNIAAMKSLGTECVNFSVTDSSLQNRAHRISSADASGRLRPEVDTGFCSPLWVLDSGGAPPPWIYDTGANFSLTGDLNLLPGVCSTGDCSPFLGLHRADPVSAANGHSIVSNKCGRASGTVNLSRTAPQTTGLISSSEPVAADNSSLLTPDTMPEQTWRVASAAPQHMTGYLNHLIDYTPASGDQVIDTPNMGRMAVHGHGSVNTTNITLQDVLYVPCLDANLVSTGQLAQLGYMSILGPYGCRIYKEDEDMPLVGEAHYVDGYLLELDFLRVRPSTN